MFWILFPIFAVLCLLLMAIERAPADDMSEADDCGIEHANPTA